MSQWAPWEVPRKPTRQRGRSGHGAAACCLRPPRERASARLSARPCPAPHCLLGSRQCPGPTAPPGPSGLGSRREEGVGAWGLGEEERGSREVFLSSTNRRQCCSVFSLPALPADLASAPAGGSLCGPLARPRPTHRCAPLPLPRPPVLRPVRPALTPAPLGSGSKISWAGGPSRPLASWLRATVRSSSGRPPACSV